MDRCCTPPPPPRPSAEELGTGGGLPCLDTPPTSRPLQQPPDRSPLSTVLLLSCSSNSNGSLADALSVDMTPTRATPPRRLTRSTARASLQHTPLTQRSLAALSAEAEGTPVLLLLPPHDHAGAITNPHPTTMTAAGVMDWLAATQPEPCSSIQGRDLEEELPHTPPLSTSRQGEEAAVAVATAVKEKPQGGYHAVPPRTPWCVFAACPTSTTAAAALSPSPPPPSPSTALDKAAHTPPQQRRSTAYPHLTAPPHPLAAAAAATMTTVAASASRRPPRVALGPSPASTDGVAATAAAGTAGKEPAPDFSISLRLCTLSGLTLRLNVDRRLPLSVLVDRVARHLHLRHAELQLTFARTGAVFTSGDCASTVRLCDLPGLAPSDVFAVLLRPRTTTTTATTTTAAAAASRGKSFVSTTTTPPLPTTGGKEANRRRSATPAAAETPSPHRTRRRLMSPTRCHTPAPSLGPRVDFIHNQQQNDSRSGGGGGASPPFPSPGAARSVGSGGAASHAHAKRAHNGSSSTGEREALR